jgi:CBS domain-containing membrane protein
MRKLFSLFGVEQAPVSHAERITSALGGFVAILSILVVSQWAVGPYAAAMIVASMGASAVLLFAVPHGPLSQPWPLIGGQIISAIIGVAIARYVPDKIIAASLAVGLAIGAMYYLRCVHPPGGATALSAVIGGDSVHELGYQFVITPILLNVIIIFLVAILFNYPFKWRRYPVFLHRRKGYQEEESFNEGESPISHADFIYALSQIDSFIDVNEEDLLRIYNLAMKNSRETSIDPEEVRIGNFYSNGEYGEDWSVRQLVDESSHDDPSKDLVIYKVIAGRDRRKSGYLTRKEFLQWAKYQVVRDEENWKRIEQD